MSFVHSSDLLSGDVMEYSSEYLLDPIDYDVSFSETKTSHVLLKQQFQKNFEEVQAMNPKFDNNNLLKLYQSAQYFAQKLESTKLYKKVDVFLLPGQDQIKVHFKIEDKSPFFLSLQNNFDRDGTATVQFKTGLKNFLGFQDTLTFDFERQLNRGKLNWSLMWALSRPQGDSFHFSVSQSERQLFPTLTEGKKGFLFRYVKNQQTEWTFERAIRSNQISFQNSTLQGVVQNQTFLKYLDFMPNSIYSLSLDHVLFNRMEESEREKQSITIIYSIKQGQSLKVRGEIQLSCLKGTLTHHWEKPLFKFKDILRNFKYATFTTDWSCGLALSRDLKVNDTFVNPQLRGYQYLQDEEEFNVYNQSTKRKCDFFGKFDFKLNFHQKNLKYFYYLGGYIPLRLSGGFGMGMQITENASIELLVNMFHYSRRFDGRSRFQLRVAMD